MSAQPSLLFGPAPARAAAHDIAPLGDRLAHDTGRLVRHQDVSPKVAEAGSGPVRASSSTHSAAGADAPAALFLGGDRPAQRALATLRAGDPAEALALLRQEAPPRFAASIALLAHGYPDYADTVLVAELAAA
jgi:hypothetical protein